MGLRANIGAERHVKGWENFDINGAPGTYHWDIRSPLMSEPTFAGAFDYAVAHHVLSQLDHHELLPALRNIRTVIRPGGWLRVTDIDIEKGIEPWLRGHDGWFPQDDRTGGPGAKFCTWVTWFGTRRSVFVPPYMDELLRLAGFGRVVRTSLHITASGDAGICALDGREAESLFMEAQA